MKHMYLVILNSLNKKPFSQTLNRNLYNLLNPKPSPQTPNPLNPTPYVEAEHHLQALELEAAGIVAPGRWLGRLGRRLRL